MIIWPQYIDKNKSRKEGRKVSKEIAVRNPSIKLIEKALKKMNLNYKIYSDKRYPREHWERVGYIEVEYNGKKLEFLKKLCKVIREL
ncbi:Ribonucleoprotein complex SRP, Srp19 component [Methanocaldococcus infernus ME]|uniref:Signal recognition particle 19 kDa protein n=1 Tax=Methanocaldococcus infernus (strain DSM 11812 / JCM 15783 / ME) TaxID=573063 RepID=D5VQH3_METIM|nr:signal recognition particle subunit SRP19/SEC65 family protein [Methanocaldococcus infernus]ADG12826.1 Ribonucleoprotein complex SRP, Srp19 component [Methanocaldococcus infernus ME]